MTTAAVPAEESPPRTACEHIALGLALWVGGADGCSREELACRLYRLADDVATGGRLWIDAVEYARELAKAPAGAG